MNKDQLKAKISNALLKVQQKKISDEDACADICVAFSRYAERNTDFDVAEIEGRVREAITNFLQEVEPDRPGMAIHDAIDHMLHG